MSWNWRTSSLWQRLLVALLIVAAASMLRKMFFGGLGRNTPYLLYFPAVTLAALYGGLAAGSLATFLSAALTFFWIQRGYLSPVESLALAVFFITCTLISSLCEMLLRARARAKLAQEKTEAANQELRSEVAERKRAGEALRQSEEFNRRIIGSSHDCIKVLDLDANLLSMSEGGQRLLGITDIAPYLNRSWVEFWQEADRPRVREAVAAARAGNVGRFQAFYPAVTGQPRWWDVIVTPICDALGQPWQLLAVSRDVTARQQVDEKLREANAYLENLFNHANVPIIVWDPQFRITRFNHAFESLTGRSAGEVIGKPLKILFPPALVESSMALIKKTTGGERWETVEIPILHLDGSVRTVLWNSATVFAVDGTTPVAAIAQGQDITERRRAEEALREEDERLRLAHHAARVGAFDWNMQTGVNIWTPELEAMYGLKPGEFGSTQPAWEQLVFAEDRLRAAGIVRRAIETCDPQEGEWRVIWPDGSMHWLFGRFQVFRDLAGRPSRLVGVNVDITGRKRAEEALRESERRLRELTESLPQLIWTCRAEGPCDYLSPQWVAYTGIAAEQQLGFGWLEQLHPEDRAPTIARWSDAVGTGRFFDVEFRIRRSDGVYRWFRTRAVPLRDNEGKVVKWFGSNSDMDDQKRAEEQLRQSLADLERSNRELEQFAYVASHDLQEPLRMISSYTQLLAQRFGNQLDDKGRKYANYAVDGAIRLQSLINDLLTYSRVGSRGKAPEPTDSHAVLGEAARNLATLIEESRAIITNDDLPTVLADSVQLVLVFQNLLSNAIKFRRRDSPSIHVSAREHKAEWVFAVKDNGIGIEPQHAERVFVIFQRLHTREEYPGTGIGLAVCKRIVERHHGRIWFESAPGSGTTFFFTLPK